MGFSIFVFLENKKKNLFYLLFFFPIFIFLKPLADISSCFKHKHKYILIISPQMLREGYAEFK